MTAQDYYIEIDHFQAMKAGQSLCGDVVENLRLDNQKRTVIALCDGLGSGIKAHILSTLTSTIATHFAASESNLRRYAEIIGKILPECSERKIGYSTFTIADINYKGEVKLIEFDNPSAILIRDGKHETIKRKKTKVSYGSLGNRFVYNSEISLRKSDKLIICSDGITESGRGKNDMPWGWGEENLIEFCCNLCNKNEISARQMARSIVETAIKNEDGKCRDDATALVINIREPRKAIVVTGPPSEEKFDAYIADKLKNFTGKKIVCGGTTAQIIARKLGTILHTNISDMNINLPPVSEIEGVDLVTEGILTLTKLEELLENDTGNHEGGNAAEILMENMLESDIIYFLVGTKLNQFHYGPDFPIEVEIRRTLIKRVKRILEEKFLKKVEIELI